MDEHSGELIQAYLDSLYNPMTEDIKQSIFGKGNEIYGELYYYSVEKFLKQITISADDHFLDVGSGLGKVVLQVFLTTPASSVTGIEINPKRFEIADAVLKKFKEQVPSAFEDTNKNKAPRQASFILGDFLELPSEQLNTVTIAYLCDTIFSLELLHAMGQKLNELPRLHTVITMRKLPALKGFQLKKKIFVHGSWDYVICYIYERNKEMMRKKE